MVEPKGWHSRGYLPHFDSPETVQFVTFRLADSLPLSVVRGRRPTEDAALQIDSELDQGLGACWLMQPEIARLVQDALLHFDGDRYRLLAWCLMPNHVHVVVEMLTGHSLSDVVRSWKGFTARRANQRLRRSGPFWHADYFDRFMRNEEQLDRTINYVEQNPVKAGLVDCPDKWTWSSAARRSAKTA
jgi:putative transposase